MRGPASETMASQAFAAAAEQLYGAPLLRHYVSGWAAGAVTEPMSVPHFTSTFRSPDAVELLRDLLRAPNHPARSQLVASARRVPLLDLLSTRPSLEATVKLTPDQFTLDNITSAFAGATRLEAGQDEAEHAVLALSVTDRSSDAALFVEALLRDDARDALIKGALHGATEAAVRIDEEALATYVRPLEGDRAQRRAANIFSYLLSVKGIATTRRWILAVLPASTEDVARALLEEARRARLLLPPDFLRLSPGQQRYYRGSDEVAVGHSSQDLVEQALDGLPAATRSRVASLLDVCGIELDAAPGHFAPAELARARVRGGFNAGFRWLDAIGDLSRFVVTEELIELARRLETVAAAPSGIFAVPILRLLHTHALLAAPSLSKGRRSATAYTIPAVFQYLHGAQDVAFTPQIRFEVDEGDLNSSWFRGHGERFGEAFAVTFLEDAIDLNIATLARIREGKDKTPDFRARALDNSPIVFEAKGGSSWNYFKSSRTKALTQLGKGKDRITGPLPARVIVCRTYIAADEDRPSRLAVEDPPGDFSPFFGEHPDEQAVRQNLAAAAFLAGLPEVSRFALDFDAELLPAARQEMTDAMRREMFGRPYVGTARTAGEALRSVGHDPPRELERLSVFFGIDRDVVDAALRQELLGARWAREAIPRPTLGILPGEGLSSGTGLYSLLANGSLLAVSRHEPPGR